MMKHNIIFSKHSLLYGVLADLRAIEGHPSQRASRTTKQMIFVAVL